MAGRDDATAFAGWALILGTIAILAALGVVGWWLLTMVADWLRGVSAAIGAVA